jgi:hypothetical protein
MESSSSWQLCQVHTSSPSFATFTEVEISESSSLSLDTDLNNLPATMSYADVAAKNADQSPEEVSLSTSKRRHM